MSILASFKSIINSKDFTWFGKFWLLLLQVIAVVMLCIAYVIIYIPYLLIAVFYLMCTRKWIMINLWAMTNWDIFDGAYLR